MKLTQLTKVTQKTKRRLGRGHGSGRVKTSGRGTKGQKARGRVNPGFEGGQLPLIKRLPLYRGRLKNRPTSAKFFPINLDALKKLPANSEVTEELLIKQGIFDAQTAKNMRVKILGTGTIAHALIIKNISISKQALTKIEAAGGSIQK